VVEIYPADSVYKRLTTEIQSVSLDHSGGSPYFIFKQIYIFKDKASKLFGKQGAIAAYIPHNYNF
jgi:hypothetical protein